MLGMRIKRFISTWVLRQNIFLLPIFTLAVIAATWRYWPWVPQVFFGDDLVNLVNFRNGSFASTIPQALSEAYPDKFRPVFALAMHWLFGAFDTNIYAYMVFNVLLQSTSAVLVFSIARRLSRGRWAVALAVMLAVVTSRFALYQVTQVTGILEGLALTLFLTMLYCVVRINDSAVSAWRWSWLALAAGFLTENTHERYIVIFPWLCCVVMLMPAVRELSLARRASLLAAAIIAPAINIIYKNAVLHVPFFMGTGGEPLRPNVADVMTHTAEAVFSIFGVNYGPPYLTAMPLPSLHSDLAWLLALVFIITWAGCVASGVWSMLCKSGIVHDAPMRKAVILPLLLLALCILLLLPPILTIRIEQRWLLAPFIIIIFIFCWALGSYDKNPIVPPWMLAVILASSSIALDSIISRHFDNVFFVQEARFSAVVKQEIVDAIHDQSFGVGFIASQDRCQWTLAGGDFFRIYGGKQRKTYCFDTPDSLFEQILPPHTHVYSFNPMTGLTLVSSDSQADGGCYGAVASFDFLKNFSFGTINNSSVVSTPTGKGVLSMRWDSSVGVRSVLVIVSGFVYRYDAIRIERGSKLCFGVGMLYPSPTPARAIVSVTETGGVAPRVLYTEELTAPAAGEKTLFALRSIPLAAFAGKTVALSFAAETAPGQSSNAHWIGFVTPRIVDGDAEVK